MCQQEEASGASPQGMAESQGTEPARISLLLFFLGREGKEAHCGDQTAVLQAFPAGGPHCSLHLISALITGPQGLVRAQAWPFDKKVASECVPQETE